MYLRIVALRSRLRGADADEQFAIVEEILQEDIARVEDYLYFSKDISGRWLGLPEDCVLTALHICIAWAIRYPGWYERNAVKNDIVSIRTSNAFPFLAESRCPKDGEPHPYPSAHDLMRYSGMEHTLRKHAGQEIEVRWETERRTIRSLTTHKTTPDIRRLAELGLWLCEFEEWM